MKYLKIIYSIVTSILLVTIVSCSSVKKLKKITEEKSADKKEIKIDSSASKTINTDETVSNNTLIKKENLNIKYNPIFDADGKLSPFTFKSVDKTGKETTVYIEGPGTVEYLTDETKTDELKKETKSITEIVNLLSTRIEQLESEKRTLEKEKQVAPDYIKYIIWLGIAILLLSGIIIFLYFYFKTTLNKYKTLLKL